MDKNFVCRTCLAVIYNKNRVRNINEGKVKKKIGIKALLRSYLSEIDLEISKNPVICKDCLNKFTIFHTFKNKCIKVENCINTYLKRNNLNEVISLEDVLKPKPTKKDKLNISNVKEVYRKTIPRKSYLRSSKRLSPNLNFVPHNELDEKLVFMKYLNLVNKPSAEIICPVEITDGNTENSGVEKDTNSTNFNFNKALYIPLQDCIVKNYVREQTLSEENDVELLRNLNRNGSKIILNNENDILQSDNSLCLGQNQDLTITLQREMFHCSHCSKSFFNETLLQEHKRMLHNVLLSEGNCAELVKNSNTNVSEVISLNENDDIGNSLSLQEHRNLRVTLKKEMFSYCKYCNKSFLNEDLFKKHNRIHHKVCRICSYTTTTQFILQRHLKSKHKNNIDLLQNIQGQNLTVNCTLCPCETQLFYCNLRDHRLKNHIKSIGNVYTCPYKNCNYKETIAYLVAKHIEQKHDHGLLRCPLCNFKTNSANKLKRHVLTHNEKLYKCEVCWKQLTSINGLKNHLRRMHSSLCMSDVFQELQRNLNIPVVNYADNLASGDLVPQISPSVVNGQLDHRLDPKKNYTINEDDSIIISDSPISIIISDDF